MVIPFVVPEILGGVEAPPQMPLSCQKRQMPLTVNPPAVSLFCYFIDPNLHAKIPEKTNKSSL